MEGFGKDGAVSSQSVLSSSLSLPFLFCIAPLSIENVPSDTHSNVARPTGARAHFAYCRYTVCVRSNSGSCLLPSSSSHREIDGQTHARFLPSIPLSVDGPLNGARDRFIRLFCSFWPLSKLNDNSEATAAILLRRRQGNRCGEIFEADCTENQNIALAFRLAESKTPRGCGLNTLAFN